MTTIKELRTPLTLVEAVKSVTTPIKEAADPFAALYKWTFGKYDEIGADINLDLTNFKKSVGKLKNMKKDDEELVYNAMGGIGTIISGLEDLQKKLSSTISSMKADHDKASKSI